MTAETPLLEIAALIEEAGGRDLHACMQCGTCTGVCPWPLVEAFSPRRVFREMSLGLEGWEAEAVWRCVTCRACVQRCPRGLDITGIMQSARTVLQQSGAAPRGLTVPLASLRTQGNPWEGDRTDRIDWPAVVGAPLFTSDCESLLFPCCTQVYDPRHRRAARALTSLLSLAGYRFGTLKEELSCCGDQARKVGAPDVFDDLSKGNLQAFRAHGVKRVFTSSPHCLDVLRTTPGVETEHATQVLWRLVQEGRLVPTRSVSAVVTYHDPCYLGRYAGVYDAPRHLISAIPGVDFREMPRSREESLCCGGGGGGMFLEMLPEQRFSVHRVREAIATGASILVTACPYCVLMFEDAIKATGLEGELEVLDAAELLSRSIAAGPIAPGGEAP